MVSSRADVAQFFRGAFLRLNPQLAPRPLALHPRSLARSLSLSPVRPLLISLHHTGAFSSDAKLLLTALHGNTTPRDIS